MEKKMHSRLIETRMKVSRNGARLDDRREIRLLSPRSLRAAKRNARTHSKKQIKQISNAILRFGWTYPIITDDNLQIVCGHGRWEAAKDLGLKNIPVLVLHGLSEVEKRALALADNKIAANAGWDRNLLALSSVNWLHSFPNSTSTSTLPVSNRLRSTL
jgi:ParB-like nuclease family protein